ncbi:TlpA family protein disulfide reductase [Actinomadura litoris]|uniref:TlpA family protein disulfide reductase n=1 Tax=Actinomadura litoris TaxID=2678616 RepID=UPI001FA748E6|nr:hypothetical protein [Actinomadura litoris]
MTSVLMGTTLVLGTLVILNLVISVGVIQRLRVHTELLAHLRGESPTLRPGQSIGPFETVSTRGEVISDEMIKSESVIGFFSPGCVPCKERLPDFLEFSHEMRGVQQHSIAVVVGAEDEAADLLSTIGDGSTVVLEEGGGPFTNACQVKAFPTFLMVDRDAEGALQVRASGIDLTEIRELSGARERISSPR